ncbi:MAG: hypothetical protein MSH30_04620 [Campylobacter sp.]|nr:hypothetical protein [Campylobacter sp.]
MKKFIFSSVLVASLASFAFGASSANKYTSNSAYQKALNNIYRAYAKTQAIKRYTINCTIKMNCSRGY